MVDAGSGNPNNAQVIPAKKSACGEAAKRAQRERILAMTKLERMKLALRTGRVARRFAEAGRKLRDARR